MTVVKDRIYKIFQDLHVNPDVSGKSCLKLTFITELFEMCKDGALGHCVRLG